MPSSKHSMYEVNSDGVQSQSSGFLNRSPFYNLMMPGYMVVEDEIYIFMSSMLGLLAEYGLWPHVVNASAITGNVKHVHDQLQWKIRTSHASHGVFPNNYYTDEQHLMPPESMLTYMHDNDHTAKNLMFNGQVQQQLSNGNSQEFMFSSHRFAQLT
ncbi:hypothetical protein PTKIN_Ptkin01aG0390100 [Pterospermum kingtungense]